MVVHGEDYTTLISTISRLDWLLIKVLYGVMGLESADPTYEPDTPMRRALLRYSKGEIGWEQYQAEVIAGYPDQCDPRVFARKVREQEVRNLEEVVEGT